jgi:osmotically inducible lipoprotein OsmB
MIMTSRTTGAAFAALASVSLLTAGGCTQTQRYVGTGAAIGAGGGAIVGAATGSVVGGAIVGGAVGAGAGYVLAPKHRRYYHHS